MFKAIEQRVIQLFWIVFVINLIRIILIWVLDQIIEANDRRDAEEKKREEEKDFPMILNFSDPSKPAITFYDKRSYLDWWYDYTKATRDRKIAALVRSTVSKVKDLRNLSRFSDDYWEKLAALPASITSVLWELAHEDEERFRDLIEQFITLLTNAMRE